MNAREQARKAAHEADKRQSGLFVGSDRRDLFSDAASDVWEPLLRDAVAAIPTEHRDVPDCWYSCATLTCDDERRSEICDCGASENQALVARLKEALE